MKSTLISLYDIIYFLIIILIFTLWMIYKLILNFFISNNKNNLDSVHLSFKFLGFKLVPNNNFQLEFIWTMVPIIVFYFIYIPVFKLLAMFGYDDIQERSYSEKIIDSQYCHELFEYFHLWKGFFIKFGLDFDLNLVIKVIGNQWYWLYEASYDMEEGLDNMSFEDEEFSAYMIDVEESDYLNTNSNTSFYYDIEGSLEAIRLLSTDFSITVYSNLYTTFFITSYDVIHSWAIPSAGVKVDACPGRIASVKVMFYETGFFYGQCSELCGFLHGFMPISLRVI